MYITMSTALRLVTASSNVAGVAKARPLGFAPAYWGGYGFAPGIFTGFLLGQALAPEPTFSDQFPSAATSAAVTSVVAGAASPS
jgi:hypothetical protein